MYPKFGNQPTIAFILPDMSKRSCAETPEEKSAFQSLTYKGFEIGDILRWDQRSFGPSRGTNLRSKKSCIDMIFYS